MTFQQYKPDSFYAHCAPPVAWQCTLIMMLHPLAPIHFGVAPLSSFCNLMSCAAAATAGLQTHLNNLPTKVILS